MFTGLIEERGEILGVSDAPAGRRLRVRGPLVAADLVPGASIAISGVCQTVTGPPDAGTFEVVAVPETLRRTTLGSLRPGSPVNLERALRAGARLGGHWVNGHVDTTAAVEEIGRAGREYHFRVALPESIAPYVVEKGSIAVDGVSLTVGEVDAAGFRVYIIPETRARTLFELYRVGDRVNLEADILAKYVERALSWLRVRERGGGAAETGTRAGGPGPAPGTDGPRGAGGLGPEARRVLETWEGEAPE